MKRCQEVDERRAKVFAAAAFKVQGMAGDTRMSDDAEPEFKKPRNKSRK